MYYFVVNMKERERFEKKFQVPFGYYAVPYFETEDGAVGYVESCKENVRNELVVEKWESGEFEIVYYGQWYSPELDKLDKQ